MKAKIVMGIIIGCMSVALVGLLMSQRVQAQETDGPGYWPEGLGDLMWVKLAEDHMKQHGKQIKSWNVQAVADQWFLIETVPMNKIFVVTDVITNGDRNIDLVIDSSSSERKVAWKSTSFHLALNSGIVFNSNESIYVRSQDSTTRVTISGYYVDLP